jgi:hypothetical protein
MVAVVDDDDLMRIAVQGLLKIRRAGVARVCVCGGCSSSTVRLNMHIPAMADVFAIPLCGEISEVVGVKKISKCAESDGRF